MAGCPHLYTSEEIRDNVSNETYRKYLRFYSIQIKIRNPKKTRKLNKNDNIKLKY